MSYSTASIANSARRVRERRRMELELQQQQKQQQQVPLLAPRSPTSSQNDDNDNISSSNNNGNNNNNNSNHRQSTRSPKSLPLSDMEPIRATTTTTTAPSQESSRSSSPHEMWLKSVKLQSGTQFGSPPVSPRSATNEAQHQPNTTTTTGTTNSSNTNTHRPIFLHRRPPMVSPSSPHQQPQRSRSWDEGESTSNNNNNNNNNNYRPPSPSMRSASTSPLPLPSWTLQPKLQQQQHPTNALISSPLLLPSAQQPTKRLQPRNSSSSGGTAGPRIVAELGTFPTIPAKPTTTSNNRNSRYSFRRVRSTPTVIGGNNNVDSTEVLRLDESLSRSGPIHSTSSSGDDESSIHGKDHGSKMNVISNSDNNSPAVSTASSFDENPPTPSAPHEDTATTVQSLYQMMISNGPRPTHLTLEEKALWDTMQTIRYQALQEGIQQAKNEMMIPTTTSDHNKVHKLPPHPRDGSSPHSVDTSWDLGFVELQEQAVIQQRDNHRSLQAIQRVLSDVQAERDEAVGTATLRLHSLSSNKSDHLESHDNLFSNKAQTEKQDAMQRDLNAMSEHIVSLERELLNIQHGVKKVEEPEIKVTVEAFGTNSSDEYDAIIDQLEQEKDALLEKLEWKDLVIEQLEKQVETVKVKRDRFDSIDSAASVMSTPHQSTKSSSLENDEVRKELLEKTSALENAKMIIASLENASGSLAADLRKKLRERDEDVMNLQRDLSDKQKALDTLATELRDLQNTHALSIPLQNTEAAQVRRLQLSSRLETNLAEIRAAAVILESTQDASAVSSLSQLLSDSANALRDGIDVIENGVPEERRGPLRYHRELEEKNAVIQRLEDTLRAQSGEAIRYKSTMDALLRQRDDEINALHAEIKILRQQCNTNMELITRKELELTVLRDSLRVDDDGVGYISDDDPDDDDAEQADSSTASKNDGNIHTSIDFGLSQAEALATLLSRTGSNRSFDSALNRETNAAIQAVVAQSASSNEEIEALKVELIKSRAEHEKVQRQLLVEKESLSTAKMIISSLERASKTTMEELRARLQDSNTAIASLLEKSMESEKASARLRSELDALKVSSSQQQYQLQHQSIYEALSDEAHLLLAPPIQPLLLTETID